MGRLDFLRRVSAAFVAALGIRSAGAAASPLLPTMPVAPSWVVAMSTAYHTVYVSPALELVADRMLNAVT